MLDSPLGPVRMHSRSGSLLQAVSHGCPGNRDSRLHSETWRTVDLDEKKNRPEQDLPRHISSFGHISEDNEPTLVASMEHGRRVMQGSELKADSLVQRLKMLELEASGIAFRG